jgi:hypothetical protein
MTTFQVGESAELAAALEPLIVLLQPDPASRYVAELRSAATPGNGFGGPAAMPFAARPMVAAAARSVAASHPEHAALLEDLANGLDQSLAQHRANGGRV